MDCTFAGVSYFASGIGRISIGPVGQELVAARHFTKDAPGMASLGLLGPVVKIRGRLTETQGLDLETLEAAIEALITLTPTIGTLVVNGNRTFTNMQLVKYTRLGPIDRGRVRSRGYEAVFMRLPN